VPGEGKNRLVFVEFEFEGDHEESAHQGAAVGPQPQRTGGHAGGSAAAGHADHSSSSLRARPSSFDAGQEEEADYGIDFADEPDDDRNKWVAPFRGCSRALLAVPLLSRHSRVFFFFNLFYVLSMLRFLTKRQSKGVVIVLCVRRSCSANIVGPLGTGCQTGSAKCATTASSRLP
jgi:hypothetical protein